MSSVDYSDDATEADMRTRYIDPALYHDSEGPQWSFDLADHEHPYVRETYTPGKIIPKERVGTRKEGDRPDYVLRKNKTFRLAVIEAKSYRKTFKTFFTSSKFVPLVTIPEYICSKLLSLVAKNSFTSVLKNDLKSSAVILSIFSGLKMGKNFSRISLISMIR